jgi:hypothetical protein
MTDRPKYYTLQVRDIDEETRTVDLRVNAAVIERIVDALEARPIPDDPAGAAVDGQIAHKLQAVHAIITPTNYRSLH